MTVSVTVYSQPACVQCIATYRALEKLRIAYTSVDLEDRSDLVTWIRDVLGHTRAPVVVVDQDPGTHWSGYRPERIAALIGTANVFGVAVEHEAVR
jgi:glutaredoxin-like protein NrdH